MLAVVEPELTADTVWACIEVGSDFWGALATDNNTQLETLLADNALRFVKANGGAHHGAATIRDHLGISAEDCGRVGWSSALSVLPGNDLRVTYVVTDSRRSFEAGALLEGWRIEFVWDEGAWLVDPVRPHDNAIGTVDVERHQE